MQQTRTGASEGDPSQPSPSAQKTLLETLSSPLSLAIIGAFLTLMTTVVTNYLSQRATAETEQLRAELASRSAKQQLQADLIKKFVEAPKTETVRENLRFLIKAGLLPDYAANIQAYLDSDTEAAPQLGMTEGVVGTDERASLSSVDKSIQNAFRGVGRLTIVLGPAGIRFCSAFLVAHDVVLAGKCAGALSPDDPLSSSSIATFELFDAGTTTTTRLAIDTSRIAEVKSGDQEIVLIGLKSTNSVLPYKPLDSHAPVLGQRFGMAFYANDKKEYVYSADAGCSVVRIGDLELGHLCDTGAGAGGGPLLTPAGTVIGVHLDNAEGAKRAMRSDAIRKDPGVRKVFGDLPAS